MTESTREQRIQSSDDVSLVDLASMFLKRRRVFYVVFSVVMLMGVAFAILAPQKYEYVSLVKLAEKSSDEYLSTPEVMIATLENRWLPEIQSEYFVEHDNKLPFEVTFANPNSTGMVRIASEAAPVEADTVSRVHKQLVDQLRDVQDAAVARLKKNISKQIESIDSTIELLQEGTDTGSAVASALEKRLSLEATLASIEPMEVLMDSRESTERKGPARSLILLLTGLLALMVGVFLAFFSEFAVRVKERMAEI